jgi:hypothetical protein
MLAPWNPGSLEAARSAPAYDDVPRNAQPCLDRVLEWLDREHLQLTRATWNKALDETQRTLCVSYGALHATISSGRVRLATDGGAKIAR